MSNFNTNVMVVTTRKNAQGGLMGVTRTLIETVLTVKEIQDGFNEYGSCPVGKNADYNVCDLSDGFPVVRQLVQANITTTPVSTDTTLVVFDAPKSA